MDRLVNPKTFARIHPKISEKEFKNLKLLCVSGNKATIYATNDDKVFGFGENFKGSLGLDVIEDYIPSPKLNTTLSGQQLVDICFGFYYGIALTSSGQCWSWGNNEFGQLGYRSNGKLSRRPQLISALSDKKVVQICCANAYSLALTDSGLVYSWGRNYFKESDDPTFAFSYGPKIIPIGDKVETVSCGRYHATALTATGIVYIWGNNSYGQLGRKPFYIGGQLANMENFYDRPLMLDCSATLLIDKVLCGPEHTVLMTTEGDVYAFGRNDSGQIGNGLEGNQYFPVKVNEELKFKEIAICWTNDMCVGQTLDDKFYYWGLCENRPVWRPKQFSNRATLPFTLFDIYSRFAKIKVTFKTIVRNFEINNNLDQMNDNTVEEIVIDLTGCSDDNNSDIFLNNSTELVDVCDIPNTSNQTIKTGTNVLLNHFGQSFNNPSNYDIRFRFEDQYIFGHKTILNIRNSKFWTEFEPHLDIENKEIKVEDFSYKSFLAFIQYLYTNSCDIDAESVADLLTLANVYGEEELQEKCCQLFANRIDSTNVCQLYSKAIEQNINELSKYCSEYVSRNFKQIILSKEFEDLSDSLSKQLIISSLSIKRKIKTAKPLHKKASKVS